MKAVCLGLMVAVAGCSRDPEQTYSDKGLSLRYRAIRETQPDGKRAAVIKGEFQNLPTSFPLLWLEVHVDFLDANYQVVGSARQYAHVNGAGVVDPGVTVPFALTFPECPASWAEGRVSIKTDTGRLLP